LTEFFWFYRNYFLVLGCGVFCCPIGIFNVAEIFLCLFRFFFLSSKAAGAMDSLYARGTLPDDFVRPQIPVGRYFDVVADFSKTARDEQLSRETRFVAALRLSHLLITLLPRHPDMQRLPRWTQRARVNAVLAVELAENLKLELRAQRLGLIVAPPVVVALSAAVVVESGKVVEKSEVVAVMPLVEQSAKQQPQCTRVASDLFEMFARAAASNTNNNIETCGILCGVRSSSGLVITHVIVPIQTGTSDYCAATDEEGLLDAQLRLDLICIGWIHTHPQHKCFLSSVDLHTSVSYQVNICQNPILKTVVLTNNNIRRFCPMRLLW
jgi:proteasome lid subunit RPN8/RPN11